MITRDKINLFDYYYYTRIEYCTHFAQYMINMYDPSIDSYLSKSLYLVDISIIMPIVSSKRNYIDAYYPFKSP